MTNDDVRKTLNEFKRIAEGCDRDGDSDDYIRTLYVTAGEARAARNLLSRLDREAPRQLTAAELAKACHDKFIIFGVGRNAPSEKLCAAILSALGPVYVGGEVQPSQSRSPHGEGDFKEPGLDAADSRLTILLSQATDTQLALDCEHRMRHDAEARVKVLEAALSQCANDLADEVGYETDRTRRARVLLTTTTNSAARDLREKDGVHRVADAMDKAINAIVGGRSDRGWQDISTAPKDAFLLLAVHHGGAFHSTHFGQWSASINRWSRAYSLNDPFVGVVTHWMPLPPPPTNSEERSPADGQPSIEAAVVQDLPHSAASELEGKLKELSEKATEGPWSISEASLVRGATSMIESRAAGFSHIATVFPAPGWEDGKEDAQLIVALVNAYRSGKLVLSPTDPATIEREALEKAAQNIIGWRLADIIFFATQTQPVEGHTDKQFCDALKGFIERAAIEARDALSRLASPAGGSGEK